MRLLLVLFLAIASLHTAHSQRRDRSLSLDFNSWPGALQPMPDGKWLAVVRSEAIPGKNYTDSIFALIFNTEGDVLLRKRLDLPKALTSQIEDVVVTQDGGFVVSVSQGSCDVYPNPCLIQKISAEGQTVWTRFSNDSTWLPALLERAPDGNLIGLNQRQQVFKMDQSTGETLWRAEMIGPKPWYDIHNFALIPGTELLTAVGYPNIQAWGRDGSPGNYAYLLANEYEDPTGVFIYDIFMRPDGICYTFQSIYSLSTSKLFRFTKYGDEFTALKNYLFDIEDLAVTESNLFIVARKEKATMLLKADLSGNIVDTLIPPKDWHEINYVAHQGNTVATLGVSGSGPTAVVGAWQRFNAHGLWFQADDGTAAAPNAANAAVTMVQQLAPLDTQSIASSFSPTGRFYNIKGGQFQVQVTNTGTEMIHEVDVLTSFDWSDWAICLFRSAHRRHYTGLNLAPGASMLLDFGDVFGERQHYVPTELCFWTASPNEKPDTDHSDDVFCLAPTVPVSEPPGDAISISPNPVSGALLLVNQTQYSDYQFYDIAGRQVDAGRLPVGQDRSVLPVGHFQPGLYWLRIGTWVGKVVVAPR